MLVLCQVFFWSLIESQKSLCFFSKYWVIIIEFHAFKLVFKVLHLIKRMQIKFASLYMLKQLSDLIMLLTNSQYNATLEVLKGKSIGRYIQYIIEFYDVFVHSYYTGSVDYYANKQNSSVGNEPS